MVFSQVMPVLGRVSKTANPRMLVSYIGDCGLCNNKDVGVSPWNEEEVKIGGFAVCFECIEKGKAAVNRDIPEW